MHPILHVLLCVLGIFKLCRGSQLARIEQVLGIEDINVPRIDLSSSDNDEMAYLGNFESLNFYRYTGQQNFTQNITKASSHLIYYSNGTYIYVDSPVDSDNSTNAQIDHIVPFGDDSFILSGQGTILGYQLDHQVLLNISNLECRHIFNDSLSSIKAILVDNDVAYFGGSFNYTVSNKTGHSAILWNSTGDFASLLPFGGFGSSSIVNSIVKLNDDNILFAGKFNTLDDEQLLKASNNTDSQNTTLAEYSQIVSLKHGEWSSQGSLDSNNMICPLSSDQDGWTLSGSTSGSFSLSLAHTVIPNKIRIYNSLSADDQISLFRVITSPADGIMNLTYLDPSTGELETCDAWCPLLSSKEIQEAAANTTTNDTWSYFGNNTILSWSADYQEFAFVNEIPVEGLTFMALNSYGSNVGLNSIQLYEGQFAIYANNSLNEANCDEIQTFSYSELSANAEWKGSSDYVYATYDDANGLPYVNFYPNITYPGDYTINLYTPGCQDDGTCNERSIVNVTVWDQNNNSALSSVLIYQNNDYDKYDSIFSGSLYYAPMISIKYHSGIYGSSTSENVIVASKVEVLIEAIDGAAHNSTMDNSLNGLFQYQLSNFTSALMSNLSIVGNTSIDSLSLDHFPSNAELFASSYGNFLLIGGSGDEIIQITIGENLVMDANKTNLISGNIQGIQTYSDGLLLMSSVSSNETSVFNFNGTLNTWGNFSTQIEKFSNITIADNELLIFQNEYIFNTSSNEYLSNSSAFSIFISSAGSNSYGDTLFFGAVGQNEYTNLDGGVFFNASKSISTQHLPHNSNMILYDAIYINDSATAYAYYDADSSHNEHGVLIQSLDTTTQMPIRWHSPISSMIYMKNESLLAVGTQNATEAPQLVLRNLSNQASVADLSWSNNVSINSMIFFEKNHSVLVGGDFVVENVSCSGLCLFDYSRAEWKPFYNNKVSGTVTDMKIFNGTDLLISGSLKVENKSSVALAGIQLKDGNSSIIYAGNNLVETFIIASNSTDDIFALSNDGVIHISNGTAETLTTSDFQSESRFNAIQLLSVAEDNKNANDALQKRADPAPSLLVAGEMQHKKYGNLSAILYDDGDWVPFFSTTRKFNDLGLIGGQIFSNRDDSSLFSSQVTLSANSTLNSTSSSPQAGSSSTTTAPATIPSGNGSRKEKRVHRGFVVLIGLALAVGTVALLGTIGVLLSYFIGNSGKYQPLTPRIDESEMIETVPPEKLMKFI